MRRTITEKVGGRKEIGSINDRFDYGYDNVGNRLRVAEDGGDRVTWTYDPAYQLASERRSAASSYAHTYYPESMVPGTNGTVVFQKRLIFPESG